MTTLPTVLENQVPAEQQHPNGRDSSASSCSDDEVVVPSLKPPDGGWGWMVVLAAFFIHVIADGITYSFGVYLIEFIDYFDSSRSATSLIASILVGVTLGSGPLAGALVNKFGCRAVTILGSVIASFGCIISIFAPSLGFLYISFGTITGLGFGLTYLPSIVSVTFYFEKRRALATGIAVCGSGIGTFIFAPFTQYLITEYTWKGALLVHAGLILNCIVCGALMRPLEAGGMSRTPSTSSGSEYTNNRSSNNSAYGRKGAPPRDENRPLVNGNVGEQVALPAAEEGLGGDGGTQDGQLSPMSPKLPFLSPTQSEYLGITERVTQSNPNLVALTTVAPSVTMTPELKPRSSKSMQHARMRTRSHTHHSESHDASTTTPGIMYRKDILFTGSLLEIPQYMSNPDLYLTSITSIPHHHRVAASPRRGRCGWPAWLRCPDAMTDAVREMTDMSLLRDAVFILFGVSNFLTSVGFNVPYIYLPDKAVHHAIAAEDGARLISIIGTANTLSRVALGYASDHRRVNRLQLYAASLTVCGVASIASVFCVDFVSLAIYAAIFGVTTGWLFDITNNYNYSFYMMGTAVGISGAMLFFLPCVQRWQTRRRERGRAHAQAPRCPQKISICEMESTI
ncbi:PREDICTED: uncharacterized protein LOC106814187 [Priapulus caudatus]|uniref:Uncharacterized protein LOC106814187 n=1 Tax=Priapulus caudatus TaxID=37621 RepID=A0ABM1EP51_PRICU|nr:PREDICTED: uncharacterized protein LOC106814187 [Priapulus caudatus]